MAYGVISTSILLNLGVSPAVASASVHTSELFTNAASGLAHLKFGNIDKKLIQKLLIPGIIGGISGALLLVYIPGDTIKPFVSAYLLIIGLLIIWRAYKKISEKEVTGKVTLLAGLGGFFDAVGGGGWGPIVTSVIVSRGHNPRLTIGSVNLAEFFVTIAEVTTFIALIGLVRWQIIIGLIIGGVIAAPLAAYLCKKLPSRILMLSVGVLITILSLRTLSQLF